MVHVTFSLKHSVPSNISVLKTELVGKLCGWGEKNKCFGPSSHILDTIFKSL